MADLTGGKFLLFRVGDVVCAAEVRTVREIVPAQPATRIPGAPESVVGLVNVRGTLVTLVDGRRAIGLPTANGHQSIVLIDVGSKVVGLAVDEVVDMISVSADSFAERHELAGIESRFVRGVGRHEEVPFVLLDTDALFSPVLAF